MYQRSISPRAYPLAGMLLARQMLAVFCVFSRSVGMLMSAPEPLRLGGGRNRSGNRPRKSDRRRKPARMKR